jgi:hypothetical protein
VQHIALATNDIVSTVTQVQKQGVSFLSIPYSYCADLQNRIGKIDGPIEELERLGIFVDRDNEGFQTFKNRNNELISASVQLSAKPCLAAAILLLKPLPHVKTNVYRQISYFAHINKDMTLIAGFHLDRQCLSAIQRHSLH